MRLCHLLKRVAEPEFVSDSNDDNKDNCGEDISYGAMEASAVLLEELGGIAQQADTVYHVIQPKDEREVEEMQKTCNGAATIL